MQNYMTHKRTLKFRTDLDSYGHFRSKTKEPLNANVPFLENSKYYAYINMFLQKLEV